MKKQISPKLTKKTVFTFRSKESKMKTSTDPTETTMTIVTTTLTDIAPNLRQ